MQSFFRIYPFLDGNGRVARMFLLLLAIHRGYRFKAFDDQTPKQENRYISALEFAHRYAVQSVGVEDKKDPYSHLIKWLDQYLETDPNRDLAV